MRTTASCGRILGAASHAGIGDRCRRTRLVEKPRHDFRPARVLGVKQLESRPPAERDVLGKPHHPHPALTDALDKAIRADLRPRIHPLVARPIASNCGLHVYYPFGYLVSSPRSRDGV